MIDEIKRHQLKIKELEDQLGLARKDSQKSNLLQQELDALKAKFADAQNAYQNELNDNRQRFDAFLADRIVI